MPQVSERSGSRSWRISQRLSTSRPRSRIRTVSAGARAECECGETRSAMIESKAAHLARLARAAGRPLAVSDTRIALVTGQIWLDASPLSEAQRAFLEAAATPGMEFAPNGFPFDPDDMGAFRPRPLLAASLANARQYVWAR